jgi:hypothetical protein
VPNSENVDNTFGDSLGHDSTGLVLGVRPWLSKWCPAAQSAAHFHARLNLWRELREGYWPIRWPILALEPLGLRLI